MSEKLRFRTPCDSQHATGSQILLKSARRHFYHIFPSQWGNFTSKMSLLVISEILVLFINTLNTYEKFSLCNRQSWEQPIQMQLSKKQKTFSKFFAPFLKSTLNFELFDSQSSCIIRNYGLQKTWLDKCLKCAASEYRSAVNMLKAPKHCWTLDDSTFIKSCYHSEDYGVEKCLSLWYVKSNGLLLTHWLPMISIHFVIVRIYDNQIKCNYLKNSKIFLDILLHFWYLNQMLKFFFKKRLRP